MTLGFSIYDSSGKYNNFPEKIMASYPAIMRNEVQKLQKQYYTKFPEVFGSDNWNLNPKLHTLRDDEHDRWQPGMLIHPIVFNRTKRRFQFAPTMQCVSVQFVRILAADWQVLVQEPHHYRLLKHDTVETMAINDGFDSTAAFFEYFKNSHSSLKLIHWTDLSY